jgi:hypothetical protein
MQHFFGTRNCFLVNNLLAYEAFLAHHMCRIIRRGKRVGFQKGNRQLPRNLCPEREDFGPFLAELATFLVHGETAILFSFIYDTEYSIGGGYIEAFAYIVDSQGIIRKHSLDAAFEEVPDIVLCQRKP